MKLLQRNKWYSIKKEKETLVNTKTGRKAHILDQDGIHTKCGEQAHWRLAEDEISFEDFCSFCMFAE